MYISTYSIAVEIVACKIQSSYGINDETLLRVCFYWAPCNMGHYYYYIHLTAFFQDKLDKPEPEKQNHSGF